MKGSSKSCALLGLISSVFMPPAHDRTANALLTRGRSYRIVALREGGVHAAVAADCFKKGCVEVVKRGGRVDDCKVVSRRGYLCRAAAGQQRDRAVHRARAQSSLEFGWALRKRTAEGAATSVDGPA